MAIKIALFNCAPELICKPAHKNATYRNKSAIFCEFILLSFFAQALFLQVINAQNWQEQESPEILHTLLHRVVTAYPEHISAVTDNAVIWYDGTHMPLFVAQDPETTSSTTNQIVANPTLASQLFQIYISGATEKAPETDSGRVRYEPFFRKMYGNSPQEVAQKLVTIDWMPGIFGVGTYPLRVTTINGVDKKLQLISQELELLVREYPDYIPFLASPGGTFCWRYIAHTTRLSNHSFGMTIDINARLSHYWQWDLQRTGVAVSEDAPLGYRNSIPLAIVHIFEKYGFIWGGKWYHYDTMHFEYRPELFLYS